MLDPTGAGPPVTGRMSREERQLLMTYLLRRPGVAQAARNLLPPELFSEPTEIIWGLAWNCCDDLTVRYGDLPSREVLTAAAMDRISSHPGEIPVAGVEELHRELERIYTAELATLGPDQCGLDLLRRFLGERYVHDPMMEQLRRIPDTNVLMEPQVILDAYQRRLAQVACRTSGTRHGPRVSRPGARVVTAPVPWTIHQLLKRMSTLWFAPSKSMKSKFALDLAVAIGTGGMTRALGHWPVAAPLDPGLRGDRSLRLDDTPNPEGERVLYLVGEDESDEVEDMLLRICRARHTTEARCGVTLVYDPPSLATGMSEILALVREHRSTVVVLDTASALNMMGEDADSFANMHVMVAKIRELIRAFEAAGAVVWVIHHSTKWLNGRVGRENYEPMERSHVSGAGWTEAMKQFVMLNRSEPYTPGCGPERVWLQVGNRSHSTLRRVTLDEGPFNPRSGFRTNWAVTIQTREEAEAADAERTTASTAAARTNTHTAAQRAVLEYLAGRVPQTRALIQAGTNLAENATRVALEVLVDQGALVRADRRAQGGGFVYSITPADPTPDLGDRPLDLGDGER